MKKLIAMIPARLGSQRVKMKNLRLIDNRPLIWYVIEACKEAGIFDEIYVNTEADQIGNYALKQGVKYYKRPAQLASNEATNDDFLLDFMGQVPCETVIQVNPTSPFISPAQIRKFVEDMQAGSYETYHSVKKVQIECLFQGKALNFDPNGQMPPSQNLEPVMAFSSGIMGFKSSRFSSNMKEHGCSMYGGNGSVGYHVMDGYAAIDIDREDDFLLAEAVAQALKAKPTPQYYVEDEHSVHKVLGQDGIAKIDMDDANKTLISYDTLLARHSTDSWSKRVVNTSGYSATFIRQPPGKGNRTHMHPDRDEWWVIFDGEIEWTLGEGEVVRAKKHDIVFVKKGVPHNIKVVGDAPATRLAISVDDMQHVFL